MPSDASKAVEGKETSSEEHHSCNPLSSSGRCNVKASEGRGPKSKVARSDKSIQTPEESRKVEDMSCTGGSGTVKVEVAAESVGVAPEQV